MIEEEPKAQDLTTDDVDTLRVLLHNIKGISAVSTTSYVPEDRATDE